MWKALCAWWWCFWRDHEWVNMQLTPDGPGKRAKKSYKRVYESDRLWNDVVCLRCHRVEKNATNARKVIERSTFEPKKGAAPGELGFPDDQ